MKKLHTEGSFSIDQKKTKLFNLHFLKETKENRKQKDKLLNNKINMTWPSSIFKGR